MRCSFLSELQDDGPYAAECGREAAGAWVREGDAAPACAGHAGGTLRRVLEESGYALITLDELAVLEVLES